MKTEFVYQTFVALSATMFNLAAVVAFAWTSPSLPKLLAPGGPVKINEQEGTWIVSMMKFGLVISPIPAAWMMDRFGRKQTLLIGAIPLLSAWILLVFAKSFELICVFTFLAGSAIGYSFVVLPVYITEISSAHIRGYLGILQTVTCKIGMLLMYGVGPFLSIQSMAWLCTIPVCLFLSIYFWLPESPYHLLATDQYAAAKASLQKLRCSAAVNAELEQMEASVKESKQNEGTYRELFCNRRYRRSIIIGMGLSGLVELSGSQIVLQYAQTIFATLNTNLDSGHASIIFGVVQLVAAIVTCFLVDTMGRRPLLLISIVGSGICTMVIGVYFMFERRMDVAGLGWIPLTAIMLFMITYTIGIQAMVMVITSEIFPKHLRAVACSAVCIFSSFVGLILLFVYQYGVEVWGRDYVFMAFSLVTFAFVPFVVCLVKETKRQSLDIVLNTIKA